MGEALKQPCLAAQIILSVSLTCLGVRSDPSPIYYKWSCRGAPCFSVFPQAETGAGWPEDPGLPLLHPCSEAMLGFMESFWSCLFAIADRVREAREGP